MSILFFVIKILLILWEFHIYIQFILIIFTLSPLPEGLHIPHSHFNFPSFFFVTTHLIQFTLPIYSWVWGQQLGRGWPIRGPTVIITTWKCKFQIGLTIEELCSLEETNGTTTEVKELFFFFSILCWILQSQHIITTDAL